MNSSQAQQFNALQKATKTYQNETKTADHMRRREAELMKREQEQQRRLEEELRIAHGELGEETRNKKNLEGERDRYTQATEADRQANLQITTELKGTEASEKEQKVQFVAEMDSLTNESDILLRRKENKQIAALLDAEQVKWLVETKLAGLVNANDGADAMRAAEGDEKWANVAARAKEELAGMAADNAKKEAATRENNELEQFLQQLRAKVMAENSNLGQMEIDDLENKWSVNYQEENDNVEKTEDGKQRQDPMHMELFYGNPEYGDATMNDTNATNHVGYGC